MPPTCSNRSRGARERRHRGAITRRAYAPAIEDGVRGIPLDPAAQRALDTVVELNVAATLEAVAVFADLGRPLCAIGIDPGQEHRLDVGYVLPCLPEDREAARASAVDGWAEYWSPNTFRDDDAVLVADVVALTNDPDYTAAERALRDALEGQVLGPAEWVLARVARALSVASMPFPTTDDFVALAFDSEFGVLLFDQLRFAAPPDRFELLTRRGFVGAREELAS